MHKYKLLLLPVLFVIFFAGNLYAQDSLLPDVRYDYLQKLIDTAKKYYPELKIRQTQIGIAKTTYNQTKTSWLDIITPSYLYNPSQSTNLVNPITTNNYQVAITLNLGTFIAKPFLIHNAHQAVKVAQLQEQEYLLTLEVQVKTRYFTYLGALANLRSLNKSVQDANNNSELLKHKYENAETTLAEYSQALSIYYTQNSSKILGEQGVLIAKASLEELVGKRLEDIK